MMMDETITFVALEFGKSDETSKESFIQAITFFKMKKFQPIDGLLHNQNNGKKQEECIGWFDVCRTLQGRSLKALQNEIFDTKEKYSEHILLTSTQLLY